MSWISQDSWISEIQQSIQRSIQKIPPWSQPSIARVSLFNYHHFTRCKFFIVNSSDQQQSSLKLIVNSIHFTECKLNKSDERCGVLYTAMHRIHETGWNFHIFFLPVVSSTPIRILHSAFNKGISIYLLFTLINTTIKTPSDEKFALKLWNYEIISLTL